MGYLELNSSEQGQVKLMVHTGGVRNAMILCLSIWRGRNEKIGKATFTELIRKLNELSMEGIAYKVEKYALNK